MNFIAFQRAFNHLPVIEVAEVEKAFPGFDHNALTRWQKAGHLEKIRNGFYRLSGNPVAGDAGLYFMANRIYAPSYVSLQSALDWHGFIPEAVFTVTSVSTLKTQTFQTSLGRFTYHSINSGLFFGYQLENFGAFRFKIADPEKALLDLIYFNPSLTDAAHFFELRLNFFELRSKFSANTFEQYLGIVNSKSLNIRANALLKFLFENDAID